MSCKRLCLNAVRVISPRQVTPSLSLSAHRAYLHETNTSAHSPMRGRLLCPVPPSSPIPPSSFPKSTDPGGGPDLRRAGRGTAIVPLSSGGVGRSPHRSPPSISADLGIQPSLDKPVHAIIVEVQLSAVKRKRFVWPAYVATLYARLECPVSLLVVTADDAVARWAAKPISIGGLHQLTPYVLGPSGIPEVTDEVQASENPELAVLSALAHGRDANSARAAEIARAALKAIVGLDADRGSVYGDFINNALGEAARLALKSMDIRKYEYQTEFARHHYARGQAAGEAGLRGSDLAPPHGAIWPHRGGRE